jgi:N utilization substance protein B
MFTISARMCDLRSGGYIGEGGDSLGSGDGIDRDGGPSCNLNSCGSGENIDGSNDIDCNMGGYADGSVDVGRRDSNVDDKVDNANINFNGGIRAANRLLAVQFIYMIDARGLDDAISEFMPLCDALDVADMNHKFSSELVTLVVNNRETIDSIIQKYATNWQINRIAKVELCVLRVAIAEMLFRQDIPPIVTINEAIEIAKMLAGNGSKRFVNGLLDRVKDSLNRPCRTANI